MNRRPSSAPKAARRHPNANACQAMQVEQGTVLPMRYRVQLRRLDSGEHITLVGFIRLTAHGTERPAEIGRMSIGSRVTWAGACWEVIGE